MAIRALSSALEATSAGDDVAETIVLMRRDGVDYIRCLGCDQVFEADDLDRTFDFIQSYDRVTVTQAVHSILTRFTVD